MIINPQQLNIIKEHLLIDQLWLNFSEGWAAKISDHKYLLREAISEHLSFLLDHKAFSDIDRLPEAKRELKSIMDLERIPVTTYSSISISHCPILGGYALTPQPMSVGLDIESGLRLAKEETILRISEPEEFQEAPDPGFLWVAKEAAFKALNGPYQPKVISEIKITNWQQLPMGLYKFQFFANKDSHLEQFGFGVVHTHERLKIAVSCF